MSINFNSKLAIYKQIIEYIQKNIINKIYLPGKQIPSVRELSDTLSVNPNTVQKAMIILETEKILENERNLGRFVTGEEKLIENLESSFIENKVQEFVDSLRDLELTSDEYQNYIKTVLEDNIKR